LATQQQTKISKVQKPSPAAAQQPEISKVEDSTKLMPRPWVPASYYQNLPSRRKVEEQKVKETAGVDALFGERQPLLSDSQRLLDDSNSQFQQSGGGTYQPPDAMIAIQQASTHPNISAFSFNNASEHPQQDSFGSVVLEKSAKRANFDGIVQREKVSVQKVVGKLNANVTKVTSEVKSAKVTSEANSKMAATAVSTISPQKSQDPSKGLDGEAGNLNQDLIYDLTSYVTREVSSPAAGSTNLNANKQQAFVQHLKKMKKSKPSIQPSAQKINNVKKVTVTSKQKYKPGPRVKDNKPKNGNPKTKRPAWTYYGKA